MAQKKKKAKKVSKARLKLTEEQVAQLAAMFGPKFAKRAKNITVEKIEGYGLADLVVN